MKDKPLSDFEYLQKHGAACPYCGSKDISSEGIEIDGMEGVARVDCNACDNRWYDVWKLSGWIPY